jgi:hypothetical protein
MLTFLSGKLISYSKVLKSEACLALVHIAVITSNKLTNNSSGLVTSSLRPDVAHGPPVAPLCFKLPDDGESKHLSNADKILPDCTAQQPRRQPSSCFNQSESGKAFLLSRSVCVLLCTCASHSVSSFCVCFLADPSIRFGRTAQPTKYSCG